MVETNLGIQNKQKFYDNDVKSMWKAMGAGICVGTSYASIKYYMQTKNLKELSKDTVNLAKKIDKPRLATEGILIAAATGVLTYGIMLISNWNKYFKQLKAINNNKQN